MCVKFIIVSYYDEFIANKDLQQLYYNIYTTFFKSIIYKKNIIILSVHGTHNLLVFQKMAPKSMS